MGPGDTATASFTAQQIALFPTFTPTGSPVTLTQAAVATGVNGGSGWYDAQDNGGAWTAVAGCSYPEYVMMARVVPHFREWAADMTKDSVFTSSAYNATATALVPTAACTGH